MLGHPEDQPVPATLETMTLLEALRRQLRYDTWANQELFGFLVGCDLVPPQAWSLHDHILGTAANWLARIWKVDSNKSASKLCGSTIP